MKVATLYRKAGKVILETDNDALAQVATDSPQDVVVMDARQAGRPPALAAPYGQNVPHQGMAALQQIAAEMRARQVAGCHGPSPTLVAWADRIEAAASDHALLQADAERLDWLEDVVRLAYLFGASFDWAKSCEGEPGGFRFMTRHRLGARQPTLRAAIDAAARKAVQP